MLEPVAAKPVPAKLMRDPGLRDCDGETAALAKRAPGEPEPSVGVGDAIARGDCWRSEASGYRTRFLSLRSAVRARETATAKAVAAAR